MKDKRVKFKEYLKFFDIMLVIVTVIFGFVSFTSLNKVLTLFKSYSGGDIAPLVEQFEINIAWLSLYLVLLIATTIVTAKVLYDIYSSNKQSKYTNEINKYISLVDQQTDLEGVNKISENLCNAITSYSTSGNVTTNDVYASLYQMYTIKSMRAEADFDKLRNYTSLLLKACVKSLNLSHEYTEKKIKLISDASVFYDIGKLCVPGYVLYKDGNLTRKDFELAKNHALQGYNLMNTLKNAQKEGSYEQYVRDIAGFHHEKFGGEGYPFGKVGNDIPFIARLVAVVSTYDTVTRDRPYKKAMSHEEAVQLINKDRHTVFDPDIVKVFNAVESQFKRINEFKGLNR